MGIFKRWTTGVVSRVDWLVTRVENQEALVDSTIREAQQAAARARVQLGRVRGDGLRLQERLAGERQGEKLWRERARTCAEEDEARALECLRRSKRAAQLAEQLGQRLVEHRQVEQKLATDIAAMDERLAELRERRNLMRTRQSRAEALQAVGAGHGLGADLDEVFERWEVRVTEAEFAGGCDLRGDEFAEAFTSGEEQEALRQELYALRHTDAKQSQEGEQP